MGGKFRQARVGVRRSPRAHTQSIGVAAVTSDVEEQKDEGSGPEAGTEMNMEDTQEDGEEVNSVPGLDQPGMSPEVAAAATLSDADESGDDDEVLDVVENNIEEDSTTRSLSTSLSPFEMQKDVENEMVTAEPEATLELPPLLSDDVNSVSSEADSVDVVDDRHAVDVSAAPAEAVLLELEEFVTRNGRGTADDSGDVAEDWTSPAAVSCPELSELTCDLTNSELPTSSSSMLTHIGDVRRGAMWRDSLFPSDFPPEPPTTADPPSERVMSVDKAGKPDAERSGGKTAGMAQQRMLPLDWETANQQIVDVMSLSQTADKPTPRCAASSSSQPCRQNYETASTPTAQYQYQPGGGDYRYGGVGEGPHYDTQSLRHADAVVDAQRLSHMWTGAPAPLPAHQHPVSFSHLQHLVNDEFQYAAAPPPPAASHGSSCHQQRQHGSRQSSHKTHHKQTANQSQPVPNPAASASLAAAAAAGYDMFSACRIQQPLGYFPHQGAAAALPMGVVGLHHAQMAVAAAANFGQPMPAGQAANSAMYSAAAAAAYSYLNGGGLQPFNVNIGSVMRR